MPLTTCLEVEAEGSVVLPSGADPSTEQQTKGADPRTGSLKVQFPRGAFRGLPSGSWSMCSVFRLALAGRAGSGLALGLPLWALSWCLSVVSWSCSGFGFFWLVLWATTLEPSFVEVTVL